MKLYTLGNASSVSNEDYGTFDVDSDGSIVVPEDFGAYLRDHHAADGSKAWEDEIERHARVTAEELERRRDPASLYDAVEQLRAATAPRKTAAKAPAKTAAKAVVPKPPAKKAAAAKK